MHRRWKNTFCRDKKQDKKKRDADRALFIKELRLLFFCQKIKIKPVVSFGKMLFGM